MFLISRIGHPSGMRLASGEIWDACAARGKGGLLGAAPLLDPLCTPPGAPPKKVFNYRKTARARVLRFGSFLPSLRSLRRSPSATRKCQSPLSLWSKSASAKYHNAVQSLSAALLPNTPNMIAKSSVIFQLLGLFLSAFCLKCLSALRCPPSEAGRGVAFHKLARAERWRWMVLREFAKYAFFWPDKEKSCF